MGCETVLLAEDEQLVRQLVAETLERLGYSVLAAANGVEALEQLDAHDGSVDLLLTDVVMPGMRGTELARRFSELHPGVGVVLMSSHVDDEDVSEHLAFGTFLGKPFSGDQLLAALAAAQGAKR